MAIDPNHVSFSPVFGAVAKSGITIAEALTWEATLQRDPRLLVPIDLQALVVAAGETVEHADIGLKVLEAQRAEAGESDEEVEAVPEPFTDLAPRQPGVYLHWAMPDGLTQSTVEVEDSDDPEVQAASEQPPEGELRLRPLPNRWLVMRVEPGTVRRVRAWLIESERGRAVPLEDWAEGTAGDEGRTPELPPGELTITVGGDLTWSAVFDNVEDRFAFFDDLEDFEVGTGPLTYVVVGWYSDPELDPLHLESDILSFDRALRELGWSIDNERLEAAIKEAAARDRSASELGLESTGLLTGGTPLVKGSGVGAEKIPATAVDPKLLADSQKTRLKTDPWWPRQSLYHGTLFGVQVTDRTRPDPRPSPDRLDVAIGQTGTESLTALIAANLPGDIDRQLAERLQNALQYRLLEAFGEEDGVPRLEEEIHQRAFESQPGGVRQETIRQGDALTPLRGGSQEDGGDGGAAEEANESQPTGLAAAAAPGPGAREIGGGLAPVTTNFEFVAGTYLDLVGTFHGEIIGGRTFGAEPLHFLTVARALPRYYFPQDPVLTLRGLNRSLRHGFDGRYEPDETLACRISGDPIPGLESLAEGKELTEFRVDHGGVPREAEELLFEALLTDPFARTQIAKFAADKRGLPEKEVSRRVDAEARLFLHSLDPKSDAGRLTAASLVKGFWASPHAVTVWKQAWVPLYIEWEVELALDDGLSNWALGELDYEPAPGAEPGPSRMLKGRSLLTGSGAKAFANAVSALLEEEDRFERADDGLVDADEESLLRTVISHARVADTLSAALDGLREQLLGFEAQLAIGDDDVEIVPTGTVTLMRAGRAYLTRLRVVDAFGRPLELPSDALESMIISEAAQPPDELEAPAGTILQPPRILQPSRMMIRFLDAEDDAQEARIDQSDPSAVRSPVAAWLLPDHVDRALEVFDAAGEPLGQLRHESLGGGVVWEGAPGIPGPIGRAPAETIANFHTTAFVTGLVQRDAAERALEDVERSESPLSALLRVIDTTLWTVDPFGDTGVEHFSVITGRPIALVRARLQLDVLSDLDSFDLAPDPRAVRQAAYDRLSQLEFEVRLGALTRFEDGLLGYFVNDDYSHFYPVHARVPEEALPSGPHTGYLGPADSTAEFNENPTPKEIVTPYLVPDPTVAIKPGQTVYLTLLMNPGSKVHVTAGILPRKSIALSRDFIAEALDRIAPSLRMGPVLVDPKTIRMPRPSALPKDQVWTRRKDPISWRDDPIISATQEALLPDTSPVAQEGYIRVRIEEES